MHPDLFNTRPWPGYARVDLALRPRQILSDRLDGFEPYAIHIATEGPLGWVARAYCLKRKLRFTTAFHTKFPEILNAALFRHFHRPSAGVMVPTKGVLQMLERRGFRQLCNWTHGVNTELFQFHGNVGSHPPLSNLERPV